MSYTAVYKDKLINIKKEKDYLIVKNSNAKNWETIWHEYFDLDRDYSLLKSNFPHDEHLSKAVEFGNGLRLLRQDPFETTISFIISSNNQIPRIMKSVEMISKDLGKYIGTFNNIDYYSFPEPIEIAQLSEEYIQEKYKVGFRAKYIKETSERIASGEFNLNEIRELPYEEAKKKLMSLPGIGPKVSDCILLFSFQKQEAFPIDVWVNRVMKTLYLGEKATKKEIEGAKKELFGEMCGYAQQYLFYYARELGIGK
jgi:N-glycosylase/DNA lyase